MNAVCLRTEQVNVTFGGHRALTDVDLEVRTGEVTGLIGPNGAGKTTLFNVISGLLAPGSGRVVIDGVDVSRLDPHQRARLGVARTFQRLELFTDLTVRDNLLVAGEARAAWDGPRFRRRARRADVGSEADRVLALTGLSELAHVNAATVPTGIARVVELGRALMLQPRILLLDEPASGQSDEETVRFEALLRRLVEDDDRSILLVEHDMALVMEVCDRIHVLDFGQVIAVGTPAEVRADARVQQAYLGSVSP